MPLVVACQKGHGFLIQMLLEEGAGVNEALRYAVQKGLDRTIRMLLYKGGNVDYKGVDAKSLLSLACEQDSVKIVKILLEKGADFKEADVNGQTLLHLACNTDSVDLLQLLKEMSLDLNIPDKNGRYPLFLSLVKESYHVSNFLIKNSFPIAISEEDTITALKSALESGNNELSKLLVSNSYTENVSHFNKTMVYHAYRLGLRGKIEILRRNEPTFKGTYKYGYTPVILADIDGNTELSEYLQNSIRSIRDTSISDNMIRLRTEETDSFSTRTRLTWPEYEYLFQACMYGVVKSGLFKKLGRRLGYQFDFFIEPNVSIWFKQTPLCLAIRRGRKNVAKFLIQQGVNVNLTFGESMDGYTSSLSTTVRYGYTPLFAAYQRKDDEIVTMLLKHGANVDKALYDACREGYLDTVQCLLQKGADVNSMSRYSLTALSGACIGGYSAIVKFLIDQGAGVNKRDHNRRTSLHYTCKERNCRIVEILIDKEGKVNVSDKNGITPLMACLLENEENDHLEVILGVMKLYKHYPYRWSASTQLESKNILLTENHYKVTQLLIDNGADINKNKWLGGTPLSFARAIGDYRLLKIMSN